MEVYDFNDEYLAIVTGRWNKQQKKQVKQENSTISGFLFHPIPTIARVWFSAADW